MKRIVYIVILLLFFFNGFSQKITDYFIMLPDSSVMGLTKADRELIIKYSSDNITLNDMYNDFGAGKVQFGFEIMDTKNGYLKMVGQVMEGHIQFCYWNLLNGTKLIAAYEEGCGPACEVLQFDFYIYDGKKLTSANKDKIVPELFNDFFTGDPVKQKEELNKADAFANVVFDLPRTGKNMVAKFGDSGSVFEYKKVLKGNRLELIWNDGTFKKGKFSWVENLEY